MGWVGMSHALGQPSVGKSSRTCTHHAPPVILDHSAGVQEGQLLCITARRQTMHVPTITIAVRMRLASCRVDVRRRGAGWKDIPRTSLSIFLA